MAHSFANPEAFREWLERLRGNDHAAFRQFTEDYGQFLLAIIRQHLHPGTRPVVASLDLLQMIYMKMARGILEHYDFDRPEDLDAFLKHLAEFETREANRRAETGKRKPKLPVLDDGALAGAASREPDPVEALLATEMWAKLQERASTRDREILALKKKRYSAAQIATKMGLNERTVRKILEKLAN